MIRDIESFRASLQGDTPPPDLSVALKALWYDARGDWNAAHRAAQDDDSLDGELAESLCRELEQHLAECPDCRTVYDTLSRTIHIYRSLRDTPSELPQGVEERLIHRVKVSLSMD